MQTLQQKASEWSGVDHADAFAIDETNLFNKLGLKTFIDLSTNFYNRVYDDEEEEWFRSIFANSKKEEAIQNQYEFFVQRMGGPPLYSQRKDNLLKSLVDKLTSLNNLHLNNIRVVVSPPR
ncbi:Two-on-two hemoglobin-3 [Linum perenne]